MANYNKVLLIGNLTKDPELRFTPSGAPVVNLRIAVNRTFRTQAGEQKEEVCYVTIIVWGKQAESCNEFLQKGSPVFVEGRLQTRTWETEDKQQRSTIEVVAERVQFLNKNRIFQNQQEKSEGENKVDESIEEVVYNIDEESESETPF